MRHLDIEVLARAVYPIVVPRARTRNGSIAYSEVCDHLGGRWAGLEPRSQMLAAALGEIVARCRSAGLPALSALVVHAGGDKRPGNGYFAAAHPGVDDPIMREVEWAREFQAAHAATYPASFDAL